MRYLLLLCIVGLLVCSGCNKAGSGEGATDSDSDTDIDTDSDTDTDTDTDSDTDTDTDSDTDIDTDSDADTDTDSSECAVSLGGICSTTAMGCAVCPDGMYVNPTRADCPQGQWCCTPTEPVSNPCTEGDGVCITTGNDCPANWEMVYTSCGSGDATCCMPYSECPAYPAACVNVGGFCTEARWVMCPAGTEPYDFGDSPSGCGTEGFGGWCCVDALPSSCSDAAGPMCVPGDECQGCFGPAWDTDLTCEQGRVCCIDICD